MPDGQEPKDDQQDKSGDKPDAGRRDTFDAEYVSSLRRESAANRKQASELAARLKEYEDRDKTEAQKLADRAEQAEKRALAAETAALRIRVAHAKGLPADMADRLRGDDEKSLTEDAEKLLEIVKPRPGFDGGARGSGDEKTDMSSLIRRAAGYAA